MKELLEARQLTEDWSSCSDEALSDLILSSADLLEYDNFVCQMITMRPKRLRMRGSRNYREAVDARKERQKLQREKDQFLYSHQGHT